MTTTLRDRLKTALESMESPPSNADLARIAGIKPPSVSAWFSGDTKSLKGKTLLSIARALNVRPEWLDTGRGPMRPESNASATGYRIAESDESYGSMEISLIDARGSCGGGSIAWDWENRPPLVKEPEWFKRYDVRPADVFALFADGDSMADFIVDGDIAIFNKSKTDPKSGAIFLVDHPDGLKIKRLRRDIDGSWVLESHNPDKRRFPDERITPEHAEHLKIRGEFVYRQGG